MQSYVLNGEEHKIECNAWTPVIFSGEFTCEGKNGRTRREDINEAVIRVFEDIDNEFYIPPFIDMLHILWAFEKTVNPKLKGFNSWIKEQPDEILDMSRDEGSWAQAVFEEIELKFFREAASADVGADKQQ